MNQVVNTAVNIQDTIRSIYSPINLPYITKKTLKQETTEDLNLVMPITMKSALYISAWRSQPCTLLYPLLYLLNDPV